MTATEEIQDFVEHLVEDRGVKCVSELTVPNSLKLST